MGRPPTRNLVRLDLRPLYFRPRIALKLLIHLSQQRDEVLRAPPGILIDRLPVVIVRGRWTRIHHDCRSSGAHVRQDETTVARTQGTREIGRTVDAASAAEALSAGYYHGSAAQCCARQCHMQAYGARARREVSHVIQGLGVGSVIVCCGSRLE